MENNQYQQTQYQQAYQYQPVQAGQPIDPNYSEKAKDFLTKAIVSCAIASLPVGSIIAIFMAKKNREELLAYLASAGIGYTIMWAIYMIYVVIWFVGMIALVISQMN